MANFLESVLLLPQDMADLRSLKKYEVFLTMKRDLAMVGVYLYIPTHISKHYPFIFYIHSLLTLHFSLFFLYR